MDFQDGLKLLNAHQLFEMAERYFHVTDSNHSYSKAFQCYFQSAEKGYIQSMSMLGHCYFHGKGVDLDYVKAVYWYQKAMEGDDLDAECALGDCFFFEKGVKLDYEKACRHYFQAAERGNIYAQNRIREIEIEMPDVFNQYVFSKHIGRFKTIGMPKWL